MDNRWQTLLTKWTMALPMTALLTGLMLAVAIGLLGMNAPNAVYLWLFTWLARRQRRRRHARPVRCPRHPRTTRRPALVRLPRTRLRGRNRPTPSPPLTPKARQPNRTAPPDRCRHPLDPLLQRRRQRRSHSRTDHGHGGPDLLARARNHRREVVRPQRLPPPSPRPPRLRARIHQRLPCPTTARVSSPDRRSSGKLTLRRLMRPDYACSTTEIA